jgi:hypothetical protein
MLDNGYFKVILGFLTLIIIYLFTVNGYPTLPEFDSRFIVLALTTAYILHLGYLYHKSNRYFPTMFTWSLALMPWAFFLEMRLLYGSFEIDMEQYLEKYHYSITVYNAFRYVLTLFVVFVVVKDLINNKKN